MSEHPSVHIIRRHTGWNMWCCTPAGTEGIYNIEWQHKRDEVELCMRQYWAIKNELAMTNGIAMEGKIIIIPLQLQKQIL